MESSTPLSATTTSGFNSDDYQCHLGEPVNIIEDLMVIGENTGKPVNLFGANVTVEYILPIFRGISIKDNIPVMLIGNFDYITLEITVPNDESWFDNHNLLHFTSYFVSYNKNGKTHDILGSLDDSIFFTLEDVKAGNVIKVCITASSTVADYYKNLDDNSWYISRIPADHNQTANESTYNCVVRLGSLEGATNEENTQFIQENIRFKYYKLISDTCNQETFTSDEIQNTLQPSGPAPVNIGVAAQFDGIKTELNSQGLTQYPLYPYLSNFTTPKVDYPIISFYDSIELHKPVNCQANNTKENYFMSDVIHFDSANDNDYLHILFANQSALEAALTSNVQIYTSDPNKHGCINWPDATPAIINTAPELPPFSATHYPHNGLGDPTQGGLYPCYGICSVKISDLIVANPQLPGVIITERFSYNPVNLNYTEYSECHTSEAYVGPALSDEFVQELTKQGVVITSK